ncbi:MAG: hypothetical protein ACRDTD_13790 [Pseudonocardiaceae bacterium]
MASPTSIDPSAARYSADRLAWISTDLGRPDATDTHASAAWVCADNADHNGLRRGCVPPSTPTRSGITASSMPPDTPRTDCDTPLPAAPKHCCQRLCVGLAKAGQTDNTRAALVRARNAAEAVHQPGGELDGPFTCSVDRAAGFWSDAYFALVLQGHLGLTGRGEVF